MTLLEVSALRTEISTAGGVVRPVDDVSFTVEAGETVGLVGESGSGKTMTGMSVMRLLPPGPDRGRLDPLDGRELRDLDEAAMRRARGDRIAMVFQDPMTSLNPVRTIGSQLREAYRSTAAARRRPRRSAPRRCCASSACPGRARWPTTTRTGSPAGCASGR